MASGLTAAMGAEDLTAHPGFSNDKYSMLMVIGALYRPHILDFIVVEIERGTLLHLEEFNDMLFAHVCFCY